MPHLIEAPTISKLVRVATRQQADMMEPDAVLNIETHLFDVCLVARDCLYNLDVGHHLHLNIGRWSRLIKEYFPREPWLRFRDQAVEILNGDARQGATANMMFRDPDRYAKKHRWGGCLMGATFRGDPAHTPTLTFYSRTTYIGYMGILDAAIAHVMVREILDCFRSKDKYAYIPPVGFRWYISSMQLHCFKSLPYIYRVPLLKKELDFWVRRRRREYPRDQTPPFWWHAAKWQIEIEDRTKQEGIAGMEREKYGPYRRVFRRWLETQGALKKNLPPSLSVSDLNFDKAV